jgi:hypothetical protein
MLCDICIGVLTHRANLIAKYDGDDGFTIMCAHHRILETLEDSVAQGCHVCQAFWLQLSETEQEALRTAASKRFLTTPGRPVEKPQPDKLEDYFEWLTFTLLIRETWNLGGDYLFTVQYSGEGIDWKSVSSKDPLAHGLHVLQINTGMLSALFRSLALTWDL